MVDAVARHGYDTTTIGDVVALARVSRSTFYEQFASKLDCLLATYDELVGEVSARVTRAYGSGDGWREALRAAFGQFMEIVVSDPPGARLVIVEALALGERLAEHREQAARTFELLLRQSFEQAPDGGHVATATITALVGGIRRIVYIHLRADRVDALPALAENLLEWALGYQLSAREGLSAPRDPELAQGTWGGCGQVLEPSQARLRFGQRERIVIAVVGLVCERGYAALTIPAISARAGVSNQTFYQHFAGKEAAFLAAFDDGVGRALVAARAGFERQPGWPEAVCAGVDSLLAFLAKEPAFARLALVELLAAGPLGLERFERVLDTFARFLEPGLGLRPGVPGVLLQAIAGGVWSVIRREVARGRTAELPKLAPCIAYVALVPFVGAEQAARRLAEREPGAAPGAVR